MYPFQLQPVYKDYLWGGTKLRELFQKDSGYAITAESWELCCHQDGLSVIANGHYRGSTLQSVLESNRNYIAKGFSDKAKFPILIKLIDAAKDLSIQVHPSDATADKAKGEEGKAEMWYVIKSEPQAYIYYGLNREISKEELMQRANDGSICDVLNKVYVNEGDVFYILPGTVHALCKGVIVAEIQQSSNTTFRIFDYGRKGPDGKQRPLHVSRAADVVNYTPFVPEKTQNNNSIATEDFMFATIFECEYFKVAKIESKNQVSLNCSPQSFHSLLFVEGRGMIHYSGKCYPFVKGDSFFLPAGMGAYTISGGAKFLMSTI